MKSNQKGITQSQKAPIRPSAPTPILPSSSANTVPTLQRTLIAFVNPGSGGGQGIKVINDLKPLLGDDHVFDLKADKGPQKGLLQYKDTPNLIVIAAGGDGTVGWLLSVIDTIKYDVRPAVCPLALGTGNDMSRVLEWGPGYAGEDLAPLVDKIRNHSEFIKLDRWQIVCEPISEEEMTTIQNEQANLSDDDDGEDEGEKEDLKQSQEQMIRDEEALLQTPLLAKPSVDADYYDDEDHTDDDSDDYVPQSKTKKKVNDTDSDGSLEEVDTATKPKTISSVSAPDYQHQPQPNTMPRVPSRPAHPSPALKPLTTSGGHPTVIQSAPASSTTSPTTTPPTTTKKDKPKQDKKMKHRKDYAKAERRQFIANNYFSIGIDSDILLQWDKLRTNHPELFPHRAVNFGWYGMLGVKAMLDGQEIPVGRGLRSIVLLNVPSYSGGTNPWRKAKNEKQMPEKYPQAISDERLELFGMSGAFHIGRNVAGLSRGGFRIGQASKVVFEVSQPVAAQVDGEPYLLVPCRITVSHKNQAIMVFNNHKDKDNKKKNKLLGTSTKNSSPSVSPLSTSEN